MGINFDGVSPEQKAKFEKILADGKITAEEVKGLTEAEKQALAKGLGGVKLPETGEIKIGEPQEAKEESGFLGKIWDEAKDFASTTTGKVVIGGVATVTALVITGATLGTGVAVAAGLLGTTMIFSSCSNDITQSVEIKLDVSELIAALDKKEANDEKRHQDVMSALNILIAQGHSMSQIVTQLLAQGAKLDTIIDLLVINGTKTDEMISILKSLGKTTAQIYEALGNVQIEQSKQTELLKTIVNNDNIKIEYLDTILNEIRNGNELQKNSQDILNLILTEISKLKPYDSSSAEILNQILAKLVEFQQQEQDMDTKTHDMLQTIINNQEKYGDSVKQALNEILAKLDSMAEADKKRFEYIVPLLENLGDIGADILYDIQEGRKITQYQLDTIIKNQKLNATQLESLRKLIIQNNNIAQGTQDAVKNLKTQMNATQKAILDKISEGNANLADIKSILKDIKTGVENHSVKLGDISQFMNVIATSLDELLTQVKGIRVETQQGILAILAKIPDGCNCEPTDLSAIIDLLKNLVKLLEEVEKDPSDSTDSKPDDGKGDHEGILNDLDKYFQ